MPVADSTVHPGVTGRGLRDRVHPGIVLLLVTVVLGVALLPVRIGKFTGLPAHPFLIHIPVVFIPVTVLCVLALVALPRLWQRYGPAASALATFTMAATILAAGAGKTLRSELFPRTAVALKNTPGLPNSGGFQAIMGNQSKLLSQHEQAGDLLRIGIIALALILALAALSSLIHHGRRVGWAPLDTLLTRRPTVFTLRGALVLVSLFCAFMVVRTGDLGAKLVWADRVGAGNGRGAPPGLSGAPSTGRGSSELFGGSSSSTEPPGAGSAGPQPSTRGE